MRLLAFGWVSNVNGAVSPAAEVCKIARENGVVSVLDAAQAAPHLPIDVTTLNCDFIAFSGHKMLGPSGTGVLWGRRELLERLDPLVLAGGTVDHVGLDRYVLKRLPYRLEGGTPNIAGVIGLGAAVEYLESLGPDWVEAKNRELCDAMIDALTDLPAVRVLSPPLASSRIPIVTIAPTKQGFSSDVLCRTLSDRFRIVTRSGFHCAHPLFETYKLRGGGVRFSAYVYNNVHEISTAGQAVRTILRCFAF